jgi:hypothetical protein
LPAHYYVNNLIGFGTSFCFSTKVELLFFLYSRDGGVCSSNLPPNLFLRITAPSDEPTITAHCTNSGDRTVLAVTTFRTVCFSTAVQEIVQDEDFWGSSPGRKLILGGTPPYDISGCPYAGSRKPLSATGLGLMAALLSVRDSCDPSLLQQGYLVRDPHGLQPLCCILRSPLVAPQDCRGVNQVFGSLETCGGLQVQNTCSLVFAGKN